MASFHIAALRAKDVSRPLPQRHRALRWAVESYSWLTRQSFRAIYAHLVVAVSVVDQQRFTSAEISAATDLLIASRLRFLKQLEQFAATRRHQKGHGQRRPLPAAVNVLYSFNSALPLTVPPSPAPGNAPPSEIAPA
jgi:hypothetical protein